MASDVLDKTKALAFAWRLVRPGETIDVDAAEAAARETPGPFAPDPLDELERAIDDDPATPETVELRAEARAACARIEVTVDHAWTLADRAAQLAATEKIARQAAKVDLRLSAMRGLQGVRMARLFVRHWESMSRGGRKAAADACAWVELGHAELGELIVELVRAGNERLAMSIGMSYEALEAVEFDKAVLARRLAELLEGSASWTVRELAADWISAGDVEGVRPALRRALRLPHLQIRARALHALEELTPPGLDAADALFLLNDHVERRMPDDDRDLDYVELAEYATTLGAAVRRLKPEGGEWPLLQIADPDHHHGWREVLDRGWALGVLAAAYPAFAVAAIDELAKSWRVHERRVAVEAALDLPWPLAEPRLLALAADGAPSVAERARDGWLDRTATRCPVTETAGLAIDLLPAPPSERMLSRLVALRSGSLEARAALVDVLLREAPDPEALVLLLFALADDGLIRGGHGRRLPYDEARWGRRLVADFGAPAVAGLCALCERYSHPETFGWFWVLAELLKDGSIKRRDAAPLAALARRFVERDQSVFVAVDVLDRTLARDERRAFFLGMLLGTEPAHRWHAAGVLQTPKRDAVLDRRLEEALSRAVDANDFGALEPLLHLMNVRGVRAAREAAARIVERVGESMEWDAAAGEELDTLVCAARIVDAAGELADGWIDDALRRPESLRCRIALRLATTRTRRWRRSVEKLLACTSRGGAIAVEAATALVLATPPIARTDPRLYEVADRAEPAHRATLLHHLLLRRAPMRLLAPRIGRLVATASDADLEPLYDDLDRLSPNALRRLVPAIRDAGVRAMVESLIGPPDDATEWER